MNDGGLDSRKDTQNNSNQSQNKKRRSTVDDFSDVVSRVAVLQICESSGFQGFQQSALDTISGVAVRYIRAIGKTANLYANLACRNECNVFDVIQGLEDLGSVQGFFGASDVHHCLPGSGTIREILRYIGEAEEIPFAYPLPGFPVVKERKQDSTFMHKGECPPGGHIPSWLPAFPDPETYVGDENVIQVKGDETDEVGKHREADSALTNLQQQMTCNGSEPAVATKPGNSCKGRRTGENNPFLVSPLQYGEKDVSSVIPPAKLSNEAIAQHLDHRAIDNHVSAMDAFAPVVEAVKHKQLHPEDVNTSIPLSMRPTIQFKFGGSKKSFHDHETSVFQNEDMEETTHWFADDGRQDEKKRRVEQILKKHIENQEELTHL